MASPNLKMFAFGPSLWVLGLQPREERFGSKMARTSITQFQSQVLGLCIHTVALRGSVVTLQRCGHFQASVQGISAESQRNSGSRDAQEQRVVAESPQ
jgi:hypothetical protein